MIKTETAGPAARWRYGLDLRAVGATLALFLIALLFLEGEEPSIEALVAGGPIGLLIIIVGFMAISKIRPAPDRRPTAQGRFALLAVAIGVAYGLYHVGSNVVLAGIDSDIHARLVERFVTRPDWGSTFAAPVAEEIVFRLFGFSVVVWLVFRLTAHRQVAFWAGLLLTSILFAVPHLWGRPAAGAGLAGVAYLGLILLNSGVAGGVFAWMFWRWGLPHAILCHFAIDAVVLLIGPRALG